MNGHVFYNVIYHSDLSCLVFLVWNILKMRFPTICVTSKVGMNTINFCFIKTGSHRPVSKKIARDPLQDRVKLRRDPIFIKQKLIVFIPTLEVTHIVGKRIFKMFHTRKTRKRVHSHFARFITRSR